MRRSSAADARKRPSAAEQEDIDGKSADQTVTGRADKRPSAAMDEEDDENGGDGGGADTGALTSPTRQRGRQAGEMVTMETMTKREKQKI